jgi:hypothetical protein
MRHGRWAAIENLTMLMAQLDFLIEANNFENVYSRSHDWCWKACRPKTTGFGVDNVEGDSAGEIADSKTQTTRSCISDAIHFQEFVLTLENLRLGGAAQFRRSGGAPNSSPLNEISLFIPEGDVTCRLDMYREWLEGLSFLKWWYIE